MFVGVILVCPGLGGHVGKTLSVQCLMLLGDMSSEPVPDSLALTTFLPPLCPDYTILHKGFQDLHTLIFLDCNQTNPIWI